MVVALGRTTKLHPLSSLGGFLNGRQILWKRFQPSLNEMRPQFKVFSLVVMSEHWRGAPPLQRNVRASARPQRNANATTATATAIGAVAVATDTGLQLALALALALAKVLSLTLALVLALVLALALTLALALALE